MVQHRLDTRGAGKMGDRAERRFTRIAQDMGFGVKRATAEQDMGQHWDFEITHSLTDEHIKVDVKAMKRIEARGPVQSRWVWLELRNVLGDQGWVYATKADMIAFEFPEGFALVRPQLLKELLDVVLEDHLVSQPRHAQYMLYRRKGRQDVLTLVSADDIKGLAYYTWRDENVRTEGSQKPQIEA